MVTASSPSTEERGIHAGVRFHQNFWRLPSSCPAVLTTIHGPLHLQRSQHYRLLSPMAALQLLPAWWPTTPTSCLIAPSLFTVPETNYLELSNNKLTTWSWHVFHMEHLALCTGQWLWSDVWWDLLSHRQDCFACTPQWSCGWVTRAACCILKELTVCSLFMKLFMAVVQIY